jgi:hypothetical protein
MDIFSLGSAELRHHCRDFDAALYTDLQICDSPNVNDGTRQPRRDVVKNQRLAVTARNGFVRFPTVFLKVMVLI